jgi:hypothetical protein
MFKIIFILIITNIFSCSWVFSKIKENSACKKYFARNGRHKLISSGDHVLIKNSFSEYPTFSYPVKWGLENLKSAGLSPDHSNGKKIIFVGNGYSELPFEFIKKGANVTITDILYAENLYKNIPKNEDGNKIRNFFNKYAEHLDFADMLLLSDFYPPKSFDIYVSHMVSLNMDLSRIITTLDEALKIIKDEGKIIVFGIPPRKDANYIDLIIKHLKEKKIHERFKIKAYPKKRNVRIDKTINLEGIKSYNKLWILELQGK